MNVGPRRRTTTDPSFCFNDFSELLTFMNAILSDPAERPPTPRYSDPAVPGHIRRVGIAG